MPPFPGFIGGSGVTQSTIADCEDTINWYVETMQGGSQKSPRALFPSPGFLPLFTIAEATGRGACNAGGRIFMVIGGHLYELLSNFTTIQRGAIAQDANPAQLFYNGAVGGQIGISSGGNFYCYTLSTNTLTQALSGVCTQTAFAGGYFFAFNVATGEVLVSALNDGTTWNLGVFFQRSLFADPWQALFVDAYNLLWLIGTETFEVWYNTGTGTQPWAPLGGLSGTWGIASSFAFATSAMGNLWLTANRQGVGQLLLTSGSNPAPISTYAFSTAIDGYLAANQNALMGAEMFSYQQQGHTFVILHLPQVPVTLCYDIEGQSFTKRGQWLGQSWGLWAPRIYVPAFGKHLVAGRANGTICDMNPIYTTEMDGVTGIVRERVTPGVTQEHARIPIDQLELLMDVGLAPQTGQGSAPLATLQQSVDGGRTYGNERQASLGRVGQYRTRVYWNQLGAPADVVFKVRTSDPAPSRIVNAWINNLERAA